MESTNVGGLRRETNKHFAIYLVGMILVFSANLALINLQSSINIDGGLGALGSTVMFATVSLSTLSIAPLLLCYFDVKLCLIGTQLSFVVYAAANFYPAYYTIVPASFLNGVAKSCFWVCSGKYNLYFAKKYEKTGTQSLFSSISFVSGYFFCAYQSCQVFGNLIPYVIFKVSSNTHMSLNVTNDSSTRSHVSEICGANDCQVESLEEPEKYHGPEESTIYIMMSVFVIMSLVGAIGYVFVPSPDKDEIDFSIEDMNGEDNSELEVEELDMNGNTIKSVGKEQAPDPENSTQDCESASANGGLNFLKSEIKANVLHLVNTKQLLMAPMQFQFGFHISFVVSEVTRAYVACVFGLTEVGLCMAIYGVSSLIASLSCGKILGSWGRRIPAAIALSLNFALYLFYILWVPDEDSTVFVVYAMLFCCGLVDGSLQMITAVMAKVMFDETSMGRAQVGWTWWCSVGYTVMFATSTSLCVYIKLYIMLAVLLVATTTHAAVEYRFGFPEQPKPDVEMDDGSVQNAGATNNEDWV